MMKSVINQIEEIVTMVPGFTPVDQLFALYLLVNNTYNVPGNIIEIGSWCGRSTAVLGLAALDLPASQIISVDLFPEKSDWYQNPDGSHSFKTTINKKEYYANTKSTVWDEKFNQDVLPTYNSSKNIYDIFLDTLSKYGIRDKVYIIRGDSADIKSHFNILKCKFAFLDGDHGYEAVCRDIENVEQYLIPGAWICFDDAFTVFDGVTKAIEDRILNNPNYHQCQQLTRKLFVARRR